MRCLTIVAICLLSFNMAKAQDEIQKESNNTYKHLIGFQVNKLIQQVLSLSNENTVLHPYFINYSYNSPKNGWGLNSGFGYSIDNTRSGDAITSFKTEIDALDFRIGPDKKFNLSSKWVLGIGVDLIYNENTNTTETVTENVNSFPPIISRQKTQRKSKGIGGGLRANLFYRLSNRIIVGTELNYYFMYSEVKNKDEDFSSLNQNTVQEDNFIDRDLNFSAPSALFVFINF